MGYFNQNAERIFIDAALFLKSPNAAPLRVMVVDDEKSIRVALAAYLGGMGFRIMAVATAEAALFALESLTFDLVFLDLRLKEMSGLELPPKLLSFCQHLPVAMITSHATIENDVESIRRGPGAIFPSPSLQSGSMAFGRRPITIYPAACQVVLQREITHEQ